jgi:hypothetical protein
VAYLLNARIVEPEKRPLIGNGFLTRNNGVTVGSGFSVRSVPRLYKEDKIPLRESLETAVRGVGYLLEMAASLRGREPGRRGTCTVGSRYQAAQ